MLTNAARGGLHTAWLPYGPASWLIVSVTLAPPATPMKPERGVDVGLAATVKLMLAGI
jgi:hypothetical protein